MFEKWDNIVVTYINTAIYVAPGIGVSLHSNRRFHGFVLNDGVADKKIHFSDGTVMHTLPRELHYLPKGSSYRVENVQTGGCYAINFSLLDEIDENPFSISFKNYESLLRIFKEAVTVWGGKNEYKNSFLRKAVYDIIIRIKKECVSNPDKKESMITPAIEIINRDFAKNELSVKSLAQVCGISEAYFRRIFTDKFSVGPKEYINNLRLEYAKKLLESNQFTISDTAFMCGYSEPCHFSREFKKHFDVSPAEYVK